MAEFTTQNTTIARGDGSSSETFTTIGEVTGISAIGQSRALIDVTDLASSSREFQLAIKEGQEISVDFKYDPGDSEQIGARNDLVNGTSRSFKITLTNSPAETVDFTALVLGWEFNSPIDDVYRGTIRLKPTTDLTFA